MKTFDEIMDILVVTKPHITEEDKENASKRVKHLIAKYADFKLEIASNQKFAIYSHMLASTALEHYLNEDLPAYFHALSECFIMCLIMGLEINSLSDFEEVETKKDKVN